MSTSSSNAGAGQTVFITGAAGFLGRYVATHFKSLGWRVVAIDIAEPAPAQNDPWAAYHRIVLPDPALGALLVKETPAAFVHCAGRASVPLSMEDPATDFRDNTVVTFEVLEALRNNAPQCRFIFLSSAAVYGNPQSLPISESHTPQPLSPYGYHKWQCELLCEEYARIYNVPTASLRIFSAYGEGLRRQVIWDICQRALLTKQLPLRGTGNESRDFVHARDIAAAIANVVQKADCRGESYNLASGREVTIAELAEHLLGALGLKIKAQFDGLHTPGVPLCWRADISRIAALGFKPAIALEDGLRDVAQWISRQTV